jgi:hypothetical protein
MYHAVSSVKTHITIFKPIVIGNFFQISRLNPSRTKNIHKQQTTNKNTNQSKQQQNIKKKKQNFHSKNFLSLGRSSVRDH